MVLQAPQVVLMQKIRSDLVAGIRLATWAAPQNSSARYDAPAVKANRDSERVRVKVPLGGSSTPTAERRRPYQLDELYFQDYICRI